MERTSTNVVRRDPAVRPEKKPHCAMCQSPDTFVDGPFLSCRKCKFRRKTSK